MKHLKKVILCTLVAVFAFAATSYAQDNDGRTLPEVKIKNLDGKQVALSDYANNGKLTVISFWATWCTPCKKELNNIAEIYEDWQEDYDVEVLAISMDDSRNMSKVKSYVNGVAWEFDVLIDVNEDLKRALNFQTIPYTIMLDKEGKIVYSHNGYQEGDEYVLEEKIKEHND